ncbi:MAG TPA: cytidine deaminase [Methanosarcina sp.]|jgi:dCMP deaminase|uniref:dCMP deaminase n=1 Tax=Methanosarcina barkeri 3 TaxID=1434107 RepID=A0A0E3WX46_METBA|nr:MULTISPECIES: cytidine/deoxycytidylate deaminase family protein [Methanosarcina]AKB82869.1 dCMP deaminase [Methanosarcina barkeri 3]MDW5551962.1 cytidine/deoxycytidylate deaminase family protein [Methanosarcina sp.]MDW5554519.1 cytidine/deoxycytidylate deaminase family protein [Methanosarcina sp.]MDW5561270.1 cytidine/deoxycytidylate deaminase family protein [Methanosarcina sp.]HII93618.1 cytidine deaminase [Methanosarcina sp.]
MTQRPSLDEYFLEIAFVVGKRATCLRKNVGAVIVRDKRILATGYNGAPSGMNHCLEIGCIRDLEKIPSGTRQEKCRAVHAEQNAIIQAAIHGVSIAGATIYCTHQPCILCAKMIINSNIKRVVYANLYPDTDSLEFFRDADVKVEYIPFKLKSETLPLELKSETSSGN